MRNRIKPILLIFFAVFTLFCAARVFRPLKNVSVKREISYNRVLTPYPVGGVLDEIVPGDRININTAEKSELERLDGIGKALSQSIIDYREEHGEFKTEEDLKKVDGIGGRTYAQARDYITVED